jgi:hypothetical protein
VALREFNFDALYDGLLGGNVIRNDGGLIVTSV